jgi:hypothetical protein
VCGFGGRIPEAGCRAFIEAEVAEMLLVFSYRLKRLLTI